MISIILGLDYLLIDIRHEGNLKREKKSIYLLAPLADDEVIVWNACVTYQPYLRLKSQGCLYSSLQINLAALNINSDIPDIGIGIFGIIQ